MESHVYSDKYLHLFDLMKKTKALRNIIIYLEKSILTYFIYIK